MWGTLCAGVWIVVVLLQRAAMVAIVMATLTLGVWTGAAALGQAPWLETTVTLGQVQYPQAGMILQCAALFLGLSLMVYLPANRRILALETSHRTFEMTMGDVARAYALAHAEDRRGNFQMSAEFDSVRERIQFLRQHPDLETLEAPVIEAAAQMSHVSRELAQTYSDRNLARARDFLTARQQELQDFEARLSEMKMAADGIARWTRDVELEEAVAESRLRQLRETLAEVLPEYALVRTEAPDTAPEAEVADDAVGRALDRAASPEVLEKVGVSAEGEAADEEPDVARGDSNIVALLSTRSARAQ